MAEIRVQVSGPGGTLGAPMLAIADALRAIGCNVRIEDHHPMPEQTARGVIERRAFDGVHVLLEADHIIWGG